MSTVTVETVETTLQVPGVGTLTVEERPVQVVVQEPRVQVQVVVVPTTVDAPAPQTVTVREERIQIVSMGAQGPPGPQGVPGIPGAAGGSAIWDQPVAASVWHVTHTLAKHPSVTVVDSSGRVVLGQVNYLSDSALDVTFSAAFAGQAFLN